MLIKTKFFRVFTVFFLSILLCFVMNTVAFLFTPDSLLSNTRQALSMLSIEGASPELIGGYASARLDNFTAALMIKTAAYNGPESLLHKAISGTRIDLIGDNSGNHWESFCTYVDNLDLSISGLSYARYWHGYTFSLRVMLCFFTLSNIQMLLLFAQTLLFALTSAAIRKRCPAALPGFIIAYFFLMPSATGICLQYVPCTMLMQLACLAILLADKQLKHAFGMPAFFALIGLFTNYFDLLTFPLITLGFPLILYLCTLLHEAQTDGTSMVKSGILCCFGWALGFGGMWILKWVLCGLYFGFEYVSGILGQAALRVSAHSGGIQHSRINAALSNLSVILSKPAYLFILLFGILLSVTLSVLLFVRQSNSSRRIRWTALLLLLPACIPMLWFLIMANHSLDHTYFTYRNAAVSIFAMLTCLSNLTYPGITLEKHT